MEARSSCSGGPPYMSTGSGDTPPSRPVDVKRILYFVIMCILSSCICHQALSGLAQPSTWLRFYGLGFLCAVALASAALFAQLTYASWASKLTLHEESDWTLICLAGITPAFLLLARFNPLPSSDETKANCVITFAFLLRLGALIELPPVHSFAQFVLSYPTLMFLDFHRRCHQPMRYPTTCTFFSGCQLVVGVDAPHTCTHCCSTTSFLHHLGSRGVIMLLVGVVSVAVPVIISIKKYPTISPGPEAPARKPPPPPHHGMEPQPSTSFTEHQDLSTLEVPLEALGLRLFSNMSPFLIKLEMHLTELAKALNETLLVSLVCVPIGFYYFGFSICSRLMPKYFSIELITADEWLLAMSVFFVLGRESCSMHMVTLFQQMNSKLQISQAILKDMLPDHVVNLLVNNLAHDAQHPPGTNPHHSHADGGDGAEPNGALDEPLDSSRPSSHSTRPSVHGGSAMAVAPTRLPLGFALASSSRTSGGPEHSTLSLSAAASLKLAETHDCITVFQSDICGFSTWAHELPPQQVMMTLNRLYSRLDDVIINEFPSLYKVETIGDAYVVAGNLVSHDPNHAATVLRFAMRAQQEAVFVPRPDDANGEPVQLRIGLHSGPAVSGIVGKLRRRFCIFGRTMDLATRTESACPPGCIQLTESTHSLLLLAPLLANEILFKARGDVAIHGFPEPVKMFLAVSKDLLVRSKMLAAAGVEI